MKNKSPDNNKELHGDYPKPDVPVEEAWKNMHVMLLENDLSTKQDKKRKRRFLILLLVLVLVAAGFTTWHFTGTVRKEEGRTEIVIKEKNNNSQKTNPNQPLQNTHRKKRGEALINNNIIEEKSAPVDELKGNAHHSCITGNDAGKPNKNFGKTNAEIDNKVTGSDIKHYITIEEERAAPGVEEVEKKKIGNDFAKDSISINQQHDLFNDSVSKTYSKSSDIRPGMPPDQKSTIQQQGKNSTNSRFHFGLQWDVNFSLANNASYFKGYNGHDQYYMWLIPSIWGKMDINKKHGLVLHFNPYAQQFGGEQVLSIEKPMISSQVPDIVTKLIKTRGYSISLQYEYTLNSKLSLAAGVDYILLQKALYKEQLTDTSTGLVTSEKIYAATKNEYDFRFMRSSFIGWNVSAKYNFGKLSIGAGINQPISNIGSNDQFKVRPVNGSIYLQYRFK